MALTDQVMAPSAGFSRAALSPGAVQNSPASVAASAGAFAGACVQTGVLFSPSPSRSGTDHGRNVSAVLLSGALVGAVSSSAARRPRIPPVTSAAIAMEAAARRIRRFFAVDAVDASDVLDVSDLLDG